MTKPLGVPIQYYCAKCKRNHYVYSKIGKRHYPHIFFKGMWTRGR